MTDEFNSDAAAFEERIRSNILINLYNMTAVVNALEWEATPHNSFVTCSRGVVFEVSELFDYETECCNDRHIVVALKNVHGETTISICSKDASYEANTARSMLAQMKDAFGRGTCSCGPGVINHTLWHTYRTIVS